MFTSRPVGSPVGRRPSLPSQTTVSILIVVAALAGLVVCLMPFFMPEAVPPLQPPGAIAATHSSGTDPSAPGGLGMGERRPRQDADDGELPDGVTVFDTSHAGVTQLDPDLLGALRRAAADAPYLTIFVTSGWRSVAYQERLLDQATAKHGSREAASRWVATPATSAHVSGDAVDIGHADAVAWLAGHGAAYGLCQVYRNEPWHFELRPTAPFAGCPAMYADPTQDPRLR